MRLPYLISGHLYVNGVPVSKMAEMREKGILASSPFMGAKKVTPQNEIDIGRQLFRAACSQCHLPRRGFNALAPRFVGLDRAFIASLVQKTDLMRGGMPPFPGNADEAHAIARYLVGLAPAEPVSNDGAAVWTRRCAMCHSLRGAFRPVIEAFSDQMPDDIADIIANIDSMNEIMPAWTGNALEKAALASYLAEQAKKPVKEAAP
jgi:mono/diheme cytochrome c family protein